MTDLSAALRLYLVADPDHCHGDLEHVVAAAIRGGVTMVQLRAKNLSDLEYTNLARRVRSACSAADVPFLVNDRVDIALAVNADGVHLGVDDLPLESARMLGGQHFIVGYSPETDEQIRSTRDRGANYLGIGPVFSTATKGDAGDALGIEELNRRIRIGGLPAVGIGGIGEHNLAEMLASAVDGIAVVSAILKANDPEDAARQLSRNSKSSSTRGSSAGSQ